MELILHVFDLGKDTNMGTLIFQGDKDNTEESHQERVIKRKESLYHKIFFLIFSIATSKERDFISSQPRKRF